MTTISDHAFAQKKYINSFGRVLDLKNPKTLNEKTQWLKINDRTPLHTICADKLLAVRNDIAEKLDSEYLIPLIKHTTHD